jgi:hypothetical protein
MLRRCACLAVVAGCLVGAMSAAPAAGAAARAPRAEAPLELLDAPEDDRVRARITGLRGLTLAVSDALPSLVGTLAEEGHAVIARVRARFERIRGVTVEPLPTPPTSIPAIQPVRVPTSRIAEEALDAAGATVDQILADIPDGLPPPLVPLVEPLLEIADQEIDGALAAGKLILKDFTLVR